MKVTNKMTWSLDEAVPGRVTIPRKGTKTVPDDSMSMKEIMQRFTTGRPIPETLEREGVYDGNASFDSPDLEQLARMDDNERDEYIKDLRASIAARKADIQAAAAALQEQAKRAKKEDQQFDPKSKELLRQQKPVPKSKGSPSERREKKDDQREDENERRS